MLACSLIWLLYPALRHRREQLPSLMRFLAFVGVIFALTWAVMVLLVTFVEPYPRDLSQIVPATRLNK
jgi:hypothetical protein